jgi:type II secretory pathway pseudopilin PulG
MCTGIGISIAASAASGLMAAVSAMQQSQARQAQANYQAAVARNNAITARQTADAIVARGKIAEQDHRRKIKQAKGTAKVFQAANGFLVDDSTDSTNVQLVADIAELGELDILRIRDNVALEERRSLIQGVNFQAQAGLFDAKAGDENPLLAGAGSLLSGAASTFTTAKTLGFKFSTE